MKKKILFLINFRVQFFLFSYFIDRLIENNEFDIIIATDDNKLQKEITSSFPNILIIKTYESNIINELSPNIIICQHIWLAEIIEILECAKKINTPILMYDHGSLVFGSYFSLEEDEYLCGYRSEMLLCSHVACWGEIGKKYWLKYAVPEKKITITGAYQYDYLYKTNTKLIPTTIYQQLKIEKSRKIIFYLSTLYHSGINKQWNDRELRVFESLQEFTAENSMYVLVVKPHPLAILINEKAFSHDKETIFVANPHEGLWDGTIRVDINELCSIAHVVVSSASSSLVAPLILNTPIIHIEINRPVSKSFSSLGKNVFYNLTDEDEIDSVIERIDFNFDEKKKLEYIKLARALNYNNDGNSTERLMILIRNILKEQHKGSKFYMEEEEELLIAIKNHENLPYPYHNIIKYYAKKNNFFEAEIWLDEYLIKFRQPAPIVKILLDCYFQQYRTDEEINHFLYKYFKKKLLLPQHLIKFAHANKNLRFYDIAQIATNLVEDLLEHETNQYLKKIWQYELGLYYLFFNENLNKVIELFELAIKNDSTSVQQYRIFYRLGETYFKIQLFSKAKIHLKNCIKLCPDEHQAAKKLLTTINDSSWENISNSNLYNFY